LLIQVACHLDPSESFQTIRGYRAACQRRSVTGCNAGVLYALVACIEFAGMIGELASFEDIDRLPEES